MNRTCAICKIDKDLNGFYNSGSWFCIECLKQRSIDDKNNLNDRYIKSRIRRITDLGNKEMHYSIINEMREWIIKCDNLKAQYSRECYRCKAIKPIKAFAKTMNFCKRCKYKEKKELEKIQAVNLEDRYVKGCIKGVTGLGAHEMHPLLIKEGREILKNVAIYNNHPKLRLCYTCNTPKKGKLFAGSVCRECTKKRDDKSRKAHRDSCSDEYIASLFCNHGSPLKRADIPKRLIYIKKEEIKLRRTIKEIKQKEK
tara:strand:- start:241 stop:1005 length:765 start_codon:yes stop_codon:yes gene_type:complete